MERFSKDHDGGEPIPELSAEMLERMTSAFHGEYLECPAEDVRMHEAWRHFGRTLEAAKIANFDAPLNATRILERAKIAVAAPEKDVPARKAGYYAKWLSVSLVCMAAVMISVVSFFSVQKEDVPEGSDVAAMADADASELVWDTPVADEIEEMDFLLLEIENGWSSFDTELALVHTSLDIMEEEDYLFDDEEFI